MEVRNEELDKSIIRESSSFEYVCDRLKSTDNAELKKGLLRATYATKEGKTKLLAFFAAKYPEDSENLEFIAREIEEDAKKEDEKIKDKVIPFNEKHLADYLIELSKDLAELYGRAFKLAAELVSEAVNSPFCTSAEDIERERAAKEAEKLAAEARYVEENFTAVEFSREELERRVKAEKPKKPSIFSRLRGLLHKEKVEAPKVEEVNKTDLAAAIAKKEADEKSNRPAETPEVTAKIEKYEASKAKAKTTTPSAMSK